MINKKFYISGLRPIIREIYKDYEIYYSFQWGTGLFKQDMTYMEKIYYDPDGDVEEISESEFSTYVEKLKKEKGL